MENNEDKLIDEQINKIINDDSSNNEINNTTTEKNSVNALSTSTNLTQTNKPVNVNQVD